MKTVKRILSAVLAVILIFGGASASAGEPIPVENEIDADADVQADGTGESGGETDGGAANEWEAQKPFDVDAKSAILMEASSGRVLAAWNPDEPLPPASVTKIMTLLLAMEALDSGKFALSDTVQISEYAASMGGSQVFLKPGESITVEELIKSVVIASANDGAVALAELVSGGVDGFVSLMNTRAKELGMNNSNFENPTGLDDTVTNHVFSARDIAIASRELITKHPKILEYSSIWMDSIRDGAFGLTNTNRLVRFYRGANGLKTGSTSKAKFCMSATALRNGMQLIAVVMGSDTRDTRNETAKKLLDWGFSHYETLTFEGKSVEEIPVIGGKRETVKASYGPCSFLLEKGASSRVETELTLAQNLSAPVEAGASVGQVIYLLDGKEIGRAEVLTEEAVDRLGFGDILLRMLKTFFLCGLEGLGGQRDDKGGNESGAIEETMPETT